MKLFRGWKTVVFNTAVLLVMTWPEVREGIVESLGGWQHTASVMAIVNLILRLMTIGPVAVMWISKEEQDGVETGKDKQ